MPFIHVKAWPGRDEESKKKTAQAVVKAASDAMGVPDTAFTFIFEDVERDAWDNDVVKAIIEPLRDKVLIDHGKPV